MVLLKSPKLTGSKNWEEITKEEKNQMSQEDQDKYVIYLDGKKKEKLDFVKKQQAKNTDACSIYDGPEGSGKSTDAVTDMRYVTNDKFDLQKHMIGADYEEALDKLEAVEDGLGLIFDEGQLLFASNEHMKRESRDLHKIFSIIRQKRLFVIIILPSIFRLNTYFAIDRSRFLVHHYIKGGDKGYFAYYGGQRKDKLIRYGKKTHDHSCVQPSFRGRFTVSAPLENPEYKAFKRKTLLEALRQAKNPKKQRSEVEIKRDLIAQMIKNNPNKTSVELGSILGITDRRVRQIRTQLNEGESSTQST
jgi:hypothetical protein